MSVCVLPARGGSKRIPRKNVLDFHGLPMIAWSIRAALESEVFSRVVVSTDDPEISGIAVEYGAEVPFKRPADLAGDFAGTVPVIAHAVEELVLSSDETVCCLYATAPFVKPEDLRRGHGEFLSAPECDYAFSVTTFAFPIQRALRVRPDGRMEPIFPEHELARSQDLEEAWHDAGQFYFGQAKTWLEQRPIFSSNPLPIALPRHRVQDIDTPEDWLRAELLFTQLGENGS
ncbi:pseudaminic acid cytidylyltransferase [Nesterenkonia sp. MY13]|uniref:Pseudaminic acid cytidylyltransferase n=1 Tax=Nesterenkonia sedimenti TaxID=1463632 RepID=A0A7X8TLN3_9MICC|nr:pseudaminic acid cytidylyltransferase [Nesterenkonia sedimenti]NLS11061.1 pseudaminic acid cytidylyltransferase [Nesterenkonia sedimenti]